MNTQKHTPTPWIRASQTGEPEPDTASQARSLIADVGTGREWECIGINDETGFAEVVAMAHPKNAALIVRAVNSHAELVAALEKIVADSLLVPANQSPRAIADFNASLVVTSRSIARAALAKAKGAQP